MSMRDAVARFVPDGASVCMGTALEALIPFAAGHELIRQRRRDLTLIGPISDILFDQLVGAGCVRRVIAALGRQRQRGPRPQLSPRGRAARARGRSRWRTTRTSPSPSRSRPRPSACPTCPRARCSAPICRAPTRAFKPATDPWSGAPLLLVPALAPDVAILHVQRADEEGHAHVWGTLGVTRQAAFAAKRVIIVAEEIRPRDAHPVRPGPRAGARAQGGRGRPRAVRAPSRRPCRATTVATTTSTTATTRRAATAGGLPAVARPLGPRGRRLERLPRPARRRASSTRCGSRTPRSSEPLDYGA